MGNKDGTWKTRTVQRKTKELRWTSENFSMVVGVLWRPSDDDPNADGEVMEGKVIDLRDGEALKKAEEEAVREQLKLNLPRSFRTSDEDYQQHGYTRGRPGPKSLLGRTTRQKHNDRCLQWTGEALAGQKRVEDVQERRRRFVEEALKKEEKIQENKKKKGVVTAEPDIWQTRAGSEEEAPARRPRAQRRGRDRRQRAPRPRRSWTLAG